MCPENIGKCRNLWGIVLRYAELFTSTMIFSRFSLPWYLEPACIYFIRQLQMLYFSLYIFLSTFIRGVVSSTCHECLLNWGLYIWWWKSHFLGDLFTFFKKKNYWHGLNFVKFSHVGTFSAFSIAVLMGFVYWKFKEWMSMYNAVNNFFCLILMHLIVDQDVWFIFLTNFFFSTRSMVMKPAVL